MFARWNAMYMAKLYEVHQNAAQYIYSKTIQMHSLRFALTKIAPHLGVNQKPCKINRF